MPRKKGKGRSLKHKLNISIVIKYAAGANKRERERERQSAMRGSTRCVYLLLSALFVYQQSLLLLSPSRSPTLRLIKESACVFCLTIYLTFSGKLPQSADNDKFFGSQSKHSM